MPGTAHRVFLSYSSKDKEFVRELKRRLTQDGVTCFRDEESIRLGANWVIALGEAIDGCEYVVCVLSPDFCESRWAERELSIAIARERKVIPLLLVPCRDHPKFPTVLRPVQSIDVSPAATFEANYPRICRELGGTPGGGEVVSPDRSKLPLPQPLPARHRMTYRSLGDKFIGRVDEFWRLHDALFGSGVAVLVGTGGLGKTQLAVEYAHRMASSYPGGVYWVNSDQGLSTLIAQVGGAAGIEVDPKAGEEQQLAQIWHGLNGLGVASLLILDNFPENEPLQPYLPVGGRVHTLVTTRRQDLGYSQVRLGVLTIEQGIRLLSSGERTFGNEAAPLVERLGGLPLALELVKAYLNCHKSLTIAALLKEMSDSADLDLLKEFADEYRDHLPTGHDRDVVRTFQLSWDAAPELARSVLRAMGELAPVAVPRFLLRGALGLPGDSGLRDPLTKALDELVRLSLVELDTDGNPVAHRLIRAFACYRNAADSASPFDRCLAAVREQMDRADLNADGATLRELDLVAPHTEFLLTHERLPATDFSHLADRLGTHYNAQGRYLDARRQFASALKSAEKMFEPGHPEIATAQSNLAVLLRDLGQLEEACDLLRSAVASYQRAFEPGHTSIAISQSNLALVLKDLGQLEEARDLLRQALVSYEKTFEPGHPDITTVQSNLALVLGDLGQLEEARDLLRQALASDEKAFEPGHPSIAIRQSNLALVLRDLGQLEEARDLLREALASDEKAFESGHPTIAVDQSNLALVLQDLGQLEEARDLLRRALESDEETFESSHPSIAIKQSNLAMVLKDLGQLGEARDLLQRAHQTYLNCFGPDHPGTRTVRENLQSVEGEADATRG